MNRIKASLGRQLVAAAMFLVVLGGQPAQAQSQRVDVLCDPAALVAAINTANGTPGADTLDLAANCVYEFTSAFGFGVAGNSALPNITASVPITINGNGATIKRSGTSPFRLLFVSSGGSLILDGVTITGGGFAAGDFFDGGGIYNNGTLTVTNSIIAGNNTNTDGNGGGGIFNELAATLTVINSTVSGNHTGDDGAGIYNGGALTVTNSTVSGNSASSGGGIFNAYGATATVINSTLSGNNAVSIDSLGGGIHNGTGGTLTVTNSTITGNSAVAGGGIGNSNDTTIINSTISGNNSTGLDVLGISIGGGGILQFEGKLTLVNSTLAGNRAGNVGGGIQVFGGTATVKNSILWGNSSQIHGIATVTNSIVEGGFSGNLNADPLFVAPVDHTSAPTTAGDYRLLYGSSAIGAGNNANLPADSQDLDGDLDMAEPVPFDRDGNARIVNTTVDLGAYEYVGGLLKNEDFEVDFDANNVPDDWIVKNGSSDKRKCNTPEKLVSFTGNCAFTFKGGLGENVKLMQNVSLADVMFNQGDTLTLSAYFDGSNAAINAKLIVKVSYAGNPTADKQSASVSPNAGYTLVNLPDLTIGAGTVEQIKVMVKHKSAAGKLYVDSVSLLHTPGTISRSAILPPPPAPDGFRGGN